MRNIIILWGNSRKEPHITNFDDIGRRIQFFRQQQKISQMDFAEKVGISRQHACRIESGERIPSLDLLIKIAETFNIALDELLGRQLNHREKSDLYALLTDCSPEETTILLQNMKSLKAILHKYKIN